MFSSDLVLDLIFLVLRFVFLGWVSWKDGYAVCRIFQKRGTGPQNGAQYGAPFVEEEWEEADDLAMETVNGDGVFVGGGIQDFFEENDLLQVSLMNLNCLQLI